MVKLLLEKGADASRLDTPDSDDDAAPSTVEQSTANVAAIAEKKGDGTAGSDAGSVSAGCMTPLQRVLADAGCGDEVRAQLVALLQAAEAAVATKAVAAEAATSAD
jgi:hypothetical protein